MTENKLIMQQESFGVPGDVVVNRQVKDRVFTMLFSTKEAQLELYNAVNNTSYTDVEELYVTTLQGVVYMGMKNDVSFVLHNHLSFFEQQSTWNPNMPVRQLFYVAEQYKRMVKEKWLYGSTLIQLPKPQFIVFYNGRKDAPERHVLRLSDSYYKVEDRNNGIFGPDDISLELVTTVININHGHNDSVKARSKLLKQYGEFVDMIHQFQKEVPIQEATKLAIDYCIKNEILKEFLEKERDAVMSNILYEYDEEETLAYIAEESAAMGWKRGEESGKKIGEEIGKEIGDVARLISQMIKKVQKSKVLEVIADELECTSAEIGYLYDAIIACGPECKVEDVLDKVLKNQEN